MQTGMIDSVASTATPPPSTKKTPSNTMDKNAFLTLLVAQLKNQDPTQSQDPNQMVQQMTSFSTLEQSQNTNKLLTGIQNQNNGIYQTNAAGLIGKNVRVASSTLDLKGGKACMGINLSAAADVKVAIQDASGKTVAQLTPGAMSAGSQMLNWDGKDAQGNPLPDGAYKVAIDAMGNDGKPVQANASAFMPVSGVTFVDGTVMISAGGKKFPLSDINEISA